VSDDGAFAIVVIALVGSPFSSTYAATGGDPLAHAAINVAIYGPGAAAWTLRERPIRPSDRLEDGITLGASSMRWEGDALVVRIEERTTPFGRPIRGRVTVHPEGLTDQILALDPGGAHLWWPVAPLARIEVDLDAPRLRFRGHGYHDANAGDAPLGSAFTSWCWSRARARHAALLTYDVRLRDGAEHRSVLRVGASGALEALDPIAARPLARTRWGLTRTIPSEGRAPEIVRSLEDGPFYARALVETELAGERVAAVHEVLSPARLGQGWVRFLSRFRTGTAA
jgi:carotenoid 1,2-hydratase